MTRPSGAVGKPVQTMAPDRLSARAEREIVATFRRYGAISGSSARKLRELGVVGSPVLKAMVTRTIIRRAGPERFFLHEDTLRAQNAMSNIALARLGVAIIVVGIALVVYLSTRTP
jgi:hypothetical protein